MLLYFLFIFPCGGGGVRALPPHLMRRSSSLFFFRVHFLPFLHDSATSASLFLVPSVWPASSRCLDCNRPGGVTLSVAHHAQPQWCSDYSKHGLCLAVGYSVELAGMHW